MKTLTKEEYDHARGRLIAAYGALENLVKNHPEAREWFPVPVEELTAAIRAAHARCWEDAPETARKWHLRKLMQQPPAQ